MSTYGYIRVSTKEQNIDRQLPTMRGHNIPDEFIFIDKLSGKDTNRPEFQRLLNVVKPGDTIVFHELSRMSRDMLDTLKLCRELSEKNIKLIFEKDNITVEKNESNPMSNLVLNIFAAFAQMERELINERQREGIEIAKRKGKFQGGTPYNTDKKNLDMVFKAYTSGQIDRETACKSITHKNAAGEILTGVSTPTFYKILRKWLDENNMERLSGYTQKRTNTSTDIVSNINADIDKKIDTTVDPSDKELDEVWDDEFIDI